MKLANVKKAFVHIAFLKTLKALSFHPDNTRITTTSNRRSFLSKTTALVIGGGIVTANILPTTEAQAVVLSADETDNKKPNNNNPKYFVPPIPLTGKVVVITGGTTGLGLESAKRLAAAGASVVVTARTEQKGKDAVNSINDYVRESQVDFTPKAMSVTLELCDLSDVKSFPKRLEKVLGSNEKIDILMNNAGVMALPDRLITKDGYEKTFQTNHLGHFALTAKIFPLLAKDARIINVSSEAYQFAPSGIDFDNLQGEKEYGPWSSYGYSKLENIYFTKELQRRFDASNSGMAAFSLHPGAVQTDLARYLIGEQKMNEMKANGMSLQDKLVFGTLAKLTKSVQDGASTQVFLAASSESLLAKDKGKYFNNMKPVQLKGPPEDKDKALQLWQLSENLADVKFDI